MSPYGIRTRSSKNLFTVSPRPILSMYFSIDQFRAQALEATSPYLSIIPKKIFKDYFPIRRPTPSPLAIPHQHRQHALLYQARLVTKSDFRRRRECEGAVSLAPRFGVVIVLDDCTSGFGSRVRFMPMRIVGNGEVGFGWSRRGGMCIYE